MFPIKETAVRGEALVLELLEVWSLLFIPITPKSTLTQSGSIYVSNLFEHY